MKLLIRPDRWPSDIRKEKEMRAIVEVTLEHVVGRPVSVTPQPKHFETEPLEGLIQTQIASIRDQLPITLGQRIGVVEAHEL